MEMSAHERAAFERLLRIGRSDIGQSRKVANFILAWWNAGSHGGFDPTELFGLDDVIAADMATVFVCLSRNPLPSTRKNIARRSSRLSRAGGQRHRRVLLPLKYEDAVNVSQKSVAKARLLRQTFAT